MKTKINKLPVSDQIRHYVQFMYTINTFDFSIVSLLFIYYRLKIFNTVSSNGDRKNLQISTSFSRLGKLIFFVQTHTC